MATITRWNPFRELAAIQSAMDHFFEDNFNEMRSTGLGNNLPIDAHETPDTYVLVADLPGVSSDQINVNLHDNTLSIGVEVAQPELDENTRVLLQERFYGKLTRSFTLPQKIDADKVEADFENGVLTLTLPKAAEARPRQISINNGKVLKSNN
jgi:HSP20 family protein